MKVLFISRSTLFSSPGGDTKQIEMTAEYLRKLGVTVNIHLAKNKIDYAPYDLLHFFNVIRPADLLYHARKSRKPFVISTVFLDYGKFEKKNRGGFQGILNKLLSEDHIEYLKVIARFFTNGEPIRSKEYLLWGHRRSVRFLIKEAKLLLPNSKHEYQRLLEKYEQPQEFDVIPNAIDTAMYRATNRKDEKYKDAVLCVARVEGRKNQLNLVRALRNTAFKLIVNGIPSPNNKGYYRRCVREATPNIQFNRKVSEEELYVMFNSARVHVLPSYFETTGLASLEAAVMGCNVVITDRGDTVEYFGDLAYYCDPDDPLSIKKAVETAYSEPFKEPLRQKILANYTWEKAAEKTLQSYHKALQKPATSKEPKH